MQCTNGLSDRHTVTKDASYYLTSVLEQRTTPISRSFFYLVSELLECSALGYLARFRFLNEGIDTLMVQATNSAILKERSEIK